MSIEAIVMKDFELGYADHYDGPTYSGLYLLGLGSCCKSTINYLNKFPL